MSARGLRNAVLLGALLWALIGFGIWLAVR